MGNGGSVWREERCSREVEELVEGGGGGGTLGSEAKGR